MDKKSASSDDPNPDYEPAPYEESGIGTVSMLFQSISALMTRCDAVDVTIRRADKHPALIEFTVKATPTVLDKPPPAAA